MCYRYINNILAKIPLLPTAHVEFVIELQYYFVSSTQLDSFLNFATASYVLPMLILFLTICLPTFLSFHM